MLHEIWLENYHYSNKLSFTKQMSMQFENGSFVESIDLKLIMSLFEILLYTAVPCLQFILENFHPVELIAQMNI